MAHFTWAIQSPTLGPSTAVQGAVSKTYYVYIMASQRNGTLYIGVTNDLARRTAEHRDGRLKGFTQKYGVKTLVWYEIFNHIDEAIYRETRLKKFTRARKLELIQSINPQWADLAPGL
jgi:putative endonuclease